MLCISTSGVISAPTWAKNVAPTTPTPQQLAQPTTIPVIGLKALIEVALSNDASRRQFYAQSQAMRESAIASSTLMDPKLKVGFGGLPVDSFQFDDDPMTNLSVGLMQQFERGSTLDLRKKQMDQKADRIQLQVQAREFSVANSMTTLWLELSFLHHSRSILLQNQALMNEMVSLMQTNYSVGKSEAQDLLQAQLQVSQLDEKLQANQQSQNRIEAQMSEWLGSDFSVVVSDVASLTRVEWPRLEQRLSTKSEQETEFYDLLIHHPAIQMSDRAIDVSQTGVELAQAAYQPQFGIEVMYANRQANGMGGQPASDLISAYLTMDIPLFTGNRQDRNHAAAQYQMGAERAAKELLLSKMNAQVNTLLVDKRNLEQRLDRYRAILITQAQARTQAVERGYQNNTAQFNDVILANRDELALLLEQTRLETELQLTNNNLAYLLSGYEFTVAPVSRIDLMTDFTTDHSSSSVSVK